jgi:hypothetical protein
VIPVARPGGALVPVFPAFVPAPPPAAGLAVLPVVLPAAPRPAEAEALASALANAREPMYELIPETTPLPDEGRWPLVMTRMACTPPMTASAHA